MIEFLGWSALSIIIFGVMLLIIGFVDYVREDKDWQWLIAIEIILVFVMIAALAFTGTYSKIAWYQMFLK